MTTHDRVRQQLHALEALLREHHHWRMDEPAEHLFYQYAAFLYGYHGTGRVAAVGVDSPHAYVD